MNTLNSKGIEEAGSPLASVVKGAIVCLLMLGAVVVGSGMNQHAANAADATPSVSSDEGVRAGYFPAQFPAPEGAPQPHIEAF